MIDWVVVMENILVEMKTEELASEGVVVVKNFVTPPTIPIGVSVLCVASAMVLAIGVYGLFSYVKKDLEE